MGFKILDEIGVVLGNQKVNNEYYLNQVDEDQRASLKHYYEEISGKDIRYIADEDQTSMSLACEAAKKAVEANGIQGKDIDMVICVSHSLEYEAPIMARFIVEAIEGREDVKCFDMNQNCTGMLMALDIADQYFKADEHIEHVLIVQGDRNTSWNVEKTSPFFGIFGDIGCAIVLERSNSSGIRTKFFKVLREGIDSIVYPKYGYSKPNPLLYTKPGLDPCVEASAKVIVEKLGKEGMDQVKAFCISQFALSSRNLLADIIQVPKEKVPYVGNRYGYTGASSPILALKDALEKGMVKRGDSIVLWTYGAGIQHIMLEMIY